MKQFRSIRGAVLQVLHSLLTLPTATTPEGLPYTPNLSFSNVIADNFR